MPKQEEKNPNRRVVPYNNEAEVYVLGSIIIDNSVMNIANGKLIDKDFFTEKHQTIYQAMVSLYNQELEIEPLSILDEMRRLKIEIDDELKEYLFELVDTVPSTASVKLYILGECILSENVFWQSTHLSKYLFNLGMHKFLFSSSSLI